MFRFNAKDDVSPKDQVKQWKQKLRKEKRGLERQIRGIEREENKVKREIKKAAKKGDMDVVKTLAKELVRSRSAKNRIRTSAVTLGSVELQLTQNAAMAKVSGVLQQSAGVMSCMSNLVKMPEVAANMRVMAREMERAGLIEEMTGDILDDVIGDEDEESEAEEEIQKVMNEIIGDKFASAGAVPTTAVPAAAPAPAVAAGAGAGAVADDGDLAEMRTRLAALEGV